MDDVNNLTILNNRADLKFLESYNRVYRDAYLNDDPYFGIDVSCEYHNLQSLSQIPKDPLYLSINVQSLLSKHEQLLQFIQELEKSNITIEVIAVQEIWDVQYADLVNLPGFKGIGQ